MVVPVKPLDIAKSRLRGRVMDAAGDRLALAFALDTVTAALASPAVREVIVVTSDTVAGSSLARLGAHVVPDKPDAGLNAAVRYAASLIDGRPVAAMQADLPALRPEELSAALDDATATAGRCFVPDAAGTGTVLLAAPTGVLLQPQFGPGSAGRHERTGAVRLGGEWPTLRRDVDVAADLVAASRLGLGRYSAGVLGG